MKSKQSRTARTRIAVFRCLQPVGLGAALFLVLAGVSTVHPLHGANLCAVLNALDTDCGDGACSLQAALETAATNSQDDVIRLVRGTHTSDQDHGFSYDSAQGNSLRLEGGYDGNCSGRILDPANTIIEGLDDSGRLTLENTAGGDIEVEGVTVQHGGWWNLYAMHILTKVTTPGRSGNIIVTDCVVQNSDDGLFVRAGDYTDLGLETGSILIENTLVRGNSGDGVFASTNSAEGTAGQVTLRESRLENNGRNYVEVVTTSGSATTILVENNTISGNSTSTGGGLEILLEPGSGTGDLIRIVGNEIIGNTASGDGGGLLIQAPASTTTDSDGARVEIINNIVADNTAGGHGGGLDLIASSGTYSGNEGPRYLVNNTFSGNQAAQWTEAHGILLRERSDTHVFLYNNIIWGNETGVSGYDVRIWGNGTTDITSNDLGDLFQDGTVNLFSNLGADPDFVSPAGGNYHLQDSSNCIDAGDNTPPVVPEDDIDRENRPFDGDGNGIPTIDIGADEVVPPGLIFADGFETGDTSRWSQTMP